MSFIETARRAQLTACAIDTIAEQGYAEASLARICERAGISKGVLTYHFASKQELMDHVVVEIYTAFSAFVQTQAADATAPMDAIAAFLRANAAFIQTHRNHLLALLDISAHQEREGGDTTTQRRVGSSDIQHLEAVLKEGQRDGAFRLFDAHIMAVSIMALRNSMVAQAATDPSLDLNAYASELVALVERATRNI